MNIYYVLDIVLNTLHSLPRLVLPAAMRQVLPWAPRYRRRNCAEMKERAAGHHQAAWLQGEAPVSAEMKERAAGHHQAARLQGEAPISAVSFSY